jgi:hypothetical protein
MTVRDRRCVIAWGDSPPLVATRPVLTAAYESHDNDQHNDDRGDDR